MKTLLFILCVSISVPLYSVGELSQVRIKNNGVCSVHVGFPHTEPGGICLFMDEVMIGIVKMEPLTIQCARLDAICTDDKNEKEEEN